VNQNEVVGAYFRYFKTKQAEDVWANEKVDELARRDPDEGWKITRILVDAAPSNEALAFVAAGPLEDLLKNQGPAVIDRIEKEAESNDRLRLALSGVWLDSENPIWKRWHALMWKYGFTEGKRTPL